jgi:hypothetical protein
MRPISSIAASRLLLLSIVLFFAPAAAGAADTPSRLRGTVVSLDGSTLTVKGADGSETAVRLPSNLRITALAERKISDIKPGDYVGSAAVEGADGKLHAQEVHIFAESMRGAGEGHKPMSGPKQSMTNATVSAVTADAGGTLLTLGYPGGEQKIEVGPDARIVAMIAGDIGLLKPGAAVSVFVMKDADGTLSARGLQAEKDGVKPL